MTTRAAARLLDQQASDAAYDRWAPVYDLIFNLPFQPGRRAAARAAERAAGPGGEILVVGVGTGLELPLLPAASRVTGVDLSQPMLDVARKRVARQGLEHVKALLEMDAQATSFPAASFDAAVAMFVASVVPDPHLLVSELRRVVKPGGTILFVNHFAREHGPIWWAERALAPASSLLGWHPDFRLGHIFTPADLATAKIRELRPLGLFRLVELPN